jgi:Na+-driven multidrug efflux pump
MLISIASASAVHLVLMFFLVEKLNMGFDGVCWATAVHFFVRWFASQVFLWTTSNQKISCTRGQPALKRSTFTDLDF